MQDLYQESLSNLDILLFCRDRSKNRVLELGDG